MAIEILSTDATRRPRWISFGRILVWVLCILGCLVGLSVLAIIVGELYHIPRLPDWVIQSLLALTICVLLGLPALVLINELVKGRILSGATTRNFSWQEVDSNDIARLDGNLNDYQRATLTIRRLRWRARALRHQAGLMLALIFLTIMSGIMIVIFAGLLTNLDTSGSQLQLVDQTVSQAQRDFDRTTETITLEVRELSRAVERLRDAKDPKENLIDSLGGSLTRLQSGALDSLKRVDERLAAAEKLRIDALRHVLGLSLDGESTQQGVGKDSDRLLIASAITRFGVITIALFFVALLMNLYRYMSRMSAFYDGVADALVLAGGDIKRAPSFLPWVAARAIDMEKPPASPAAAIADVTKVAVQQTANKLRRDRKNKVESAEALTG